MFNLFKRPSLHQQIALELDLAERDLLKAQAALEYYQALTPALQARKRRLQAAVAARGSMLSL